MFLVKGKQTIVINFVSFRLLACQVAEVAAAAGVMGAALGVIDGGHGLGSAG